MKIIHGAAIGLAFALTFFWVAGTAAQEDETKGKPPPPDSSQAVAYQINPVHSGNISFTSKFSTSLKQLWVKNLGGPISYPLIVPGFVFVTVGNADGRGSQLYALDIKTGATIWQNSIGGFYSWSNAAYDQGELFVVDSDGLMQAFAAATGSLTWSVQLPDENYFTSPPTAVNGQVFVGGGGFGGILYAVSEATGAIQWTAGVANGDHSSPAVGDGGVYVSYPCQYYAFAPATGVLIWNYNTGCDGGGGRTPVDYMSRLYVRDYAGSNVILDAATGNLITTFNAQPAPAFFQGSNGKQHEITLSNGTLYSLDPTTGTVAWSFRGDGKLDTAPIVVNGFVVEGSNSGTLYILNGLNGSGSSIKVGKPILAPDEQNVIPLTGLGAAQGTLIVPAGSQISAYVSR